MQTVYSKIHAVYVDWINIIFLIALASTPAEKQKIFDEGNAVYSAFVQAMPKGPASAEAQACVEQWRQHMNYFWTPRPDQLVSLAEGYHQDARFKANFDKIHPDLAKFVHAAVKIYVDNLNG
jgi:MerR family transcriptional regulator, thiopeptide resistance regulator